MHDFTAPLRCLQAATERLISFGRLDGGSIQPMAKILRIESPAFRIYRPERDDSSTWQKVRGCFAGLGRSWAPSDVTITSGPESGLRLPPLQRLCLYRAPTRVRTIMIAIAPSLRSPSNISHHHSTLPRDNAIGCTIMHARKILGVFCGSETIINFSMKNSTVDSTLLQSEQIRIRSVFRAKNGPVSVWKL
jgi:hypothetical protein